MEVLEGLKDDVVIPNANDTQQEVVTDRITNRDFRND